MTNYKAGDVLKAVYNYGDETHLVDFYLVESVKGEWLTLVKLEKEHRYVGRNPEEQALIDSGRAYYDTPHFVEPIAHKVGTPIRRKNGPNMKVEDYWYFRGKWNGEAEQVYNLH